MRRYKENDIIYTFVFDEKTSTYILSKGKFISYISTCNYYSKHFGITIGKYRLELNIIPDEWWCYIEINGKIDCFWDFNFFPTVKSAKKYMKRKLKDPAHKYSKYSLGEFK